MKSYTLSRSTTGSAGCIPKTNMYPGINVYLGTDMYPVTRCILQLYTTEEYSEMYFKILAKIFVKDVTP
jgi:hypothetical protein